MIRTLSMLSALVVLGVALAACGGGSSKQGTPSAATSGTPGVPGISGAATAGQGATTPGAASSAAAGQTAGSAVASPGSGSAPFTENTPPVSGTPAFTYSTPSDSSPSPASSQAAGGDTATPVPTGPVGGAIAVGAASLAGGKVSVSVSVVGTGISPFVGFSVHLRWNPSIFTFDSANSSGTVLNGSVFCPPTQTDSDGAGAILACLATGQNVETTATGLLATFILTPAGTGCSPLHFFTYGATDGGDGGNGTYLMDSATNVVVATTVDGTVSQTGQRC